MAESELTVLLKLRDEASKELSGLKSKWGSALKGIGIGLAGAATAAVGFGIASVKSFADAGDAVQKMALRTGFTTEALSELRYAADLSGTSIEALETGLKKMARFVDDAKEGLSTATNVMAQLGLTTEDLAGLSPEETFNKLSMAIASMEDPLAKQNAALEVFGRAGTDLLPMLAEGAEGLEAMRQEAHDLGLVFDKEAAESAAEFKDNLTRLQGAFQGLMNAIAKAVLPALDPLIVAFTDLVKNLPMEQIAELMKNLLPPLAAAIMKLLVALNPLIEAVITFAVDALSPVLGILPDLLDALTPILEILGEIIKIIPIKPFMELVMNVIKPLLIPALENLSSILKALEPILRIIFGVIEAIMKVLGPVLEGFAKIIGWVAEGFGWIFEKVGGFFSWVGGVFGFQKGGIAMGPTLAMIGEKGPEAVIPLTKAYGEIPAGGATYNIDIHVAGSVIAERDLAETIRTEFLKIAKRNYSTGVV